MKNATDASISFYAAVYEIVRRIPEGTVATYGQIAALAGKPGGARAVGNALHANRDPENVKCFRVVNREGRLSGAYAFGGLEWQRFYLEEDGVEVINGRVDLGKYQWDGKPG